MATPTLNFTIKVLGNSLNGFATLIETSYEELSGGDPMNNLDDLILATIALCHNKYGIEDIYDFEIAVGEWASEFYWSDEDGMTSMTHQKTTKVVSSFKYLESRELFKDLYYALQRVTEYKAMVEAPEQVNYRFVRRETADIEIVRDMAQQFDS